MLLRYIIICLLTLIYTSLAAQLDELPYTYVSENEFLDIRDLNNFTFAPNKVDIKRTVPISLKSKQLRIHITEHKVHFSGLKDLSTYPIISKSYSSTGFDFMINMGELSFEPAYLKVVIDDDYHVHLIYLHSDYLGTHTFYLPHKSDDRYKKDISYFTSKGSISLSDYDALMDTEIKPYYMSSERQVYNKTRINRHSDIAFYFDQDRFSFTHRDQTDYNELKKVRKYKVKIPNMPRITHCIELVAESGDYSAQVYIDNLEHISVIEYRGDLYFLLP